VFEVDRGDVPRYPSLILKVSASSPVDIAGRAFKVETETAVNCRNENNHKMRSRVMYPTQGLPKALLVDNKGRAKEFVLGF